MVVHPAYNGQECESDDDFLLQRTCCDGQGVLDLGGEFALTDADKEHAVSTSTWPEFTRALLIQISTYISRFLCSVSAEAF